MWGNMNPKILSFQSCCIPCLDNDTAFGTCCRLRLLLGQKSVHCNVDSQLAERSRLCAEQWEEAQHHSWTPAALSASMTEKTQFPGFMFPQGSADTLVRRGGTTNHHLTAYSLSNIFAKKLPKSVDVRWSYSVLFFFRHSVYNYIKNKTQKEQNHWLLCKFWCSWCLQRSQCIVVVFLLPWPVQYQQRQQNLSVFWVGEDLWIQRTLQGGEGRANIAAAVFYTVDSMLPVSYNKTMPNKNYT